MFRSRETVGLISEPASASNLVKKWSDVTLDQSHECKKSDLFDSLVVTDIDGLREEFMDSHLIGN